MAGVRLETDVGVCACRTLSERRVSLRSSSMRFGLGWVGVVAAAAAHTALALSRASKIGEHWCLMSWRRPPTMTRFLACAGGGMRPHASRRVAWRRAWVLAAGFFGPKGGTWHQPSAVGRGAGAHLSPLSCPNRATMSSWAEWGAAGDGGAAPAGAYKIPRLVCAQCSLAAGRGSGLCFWRWQSIPHPCARQRSSISWASPITPIAGRQDSPGGFFHSTGSSKNSTAPSADDVGWVGPPRSAKPGRRHWPGNCGGAWVGRWPRAEPCGQREQRAASSGQWTRLASRVGETSDQASHHRRAMH